MEKPELQEAHKAACAACALAASLSLSWATLPCVPLPVGAAT